MPALVPPGLDYLLYVDQLIVQQQIDMIEMFTGWETSNRYVVKNIRGEPVYYAVEQTDLITRNYFGSGRPFDILVMDNMRTVVLRMRRPFQLQGYACCGLTQEIEITSGAGQLLGIVREKFHMCARRFKVKNAAGQTMLRIDGPACTFDWIDTDFDLLTADDQQQKIGVITRHFPGFIQEMYTHADVFGVRFPLDLDVGMKAALLGATFLIDFMYYERTASAPLGYGRGGYERGRYGYGGYYGGGYNNGLALGLMGIGMADRGPYYSGGGGGGGHYHHNPGFSGGGGGGGSHHHNTGFDGGGSHHHH